MFQIRVHGRGGQGVVTAAEMLSIAAFLEKKHAQAFPSFGSERMGAPVMAFCRISNKEIRLREPVLEPNALIIQDRTVIESSNAFQGVVENGFVLVNSSVEISNPVKNVNIKCIDATGIALEHVGRPIPNAVLLGSFAALTKIIKIDSVIEAIKTKFSGSIAEKNIKAAQIAYEETLKGI
ncbi:MAG: 2-oxoacid:acceptor oxidoreductase family protein [Holosporaceae bacterium]|jgi:pyruvate ferredoxin oxidoreductase gamma subunit|nr:2-oxoacid:acceptor oxidoreductase family protein [Holosporaceae bacterium]